MQLKTLVKGKARRILPLIPSPSGSHRPPLPLGSTSAVPPEGLCDLQAVNVRGADLGACCRSLLPGGEAGLPDSVLESSCAC